MKIDVSVVIPLLNEEDSLTELYTWIQKVVNENGLTCEVIFVDDGSRDGSWSVIKKIQASNPLVHGIRFQQNYGKSAALHVGFQKAQGDVVITMDADLQDSPDEIPALVDMIRTQGFDLVSGWKKVRHDPLSKTIPTKLYNWATRMTTGIALHDFNCGLKAYRNNVVKSLEVFGEMHRYIPVIARRQGFRNIGEKVVVHQKRKYGKTKFGMERFVNGFLDLLTITFISRFGKKPMHFFGTIGTLMFLIGFVIFGILGINKLISLMGDVPAKNLADQSIFYVALVAMVIGTQLFLAGFLGELISRSSASRNEYLVVEEI